MPENEKILIQDTNKKATELRKRIEDIQQDLQRSMEIFRKEIYQLLPTVDEQTQVLADKLNKSDVNLKTADINAVCGFLGEIGEEFSKIKKRGQS